MSDYKELPCRRCGHVWKWACDKKTITYCPEGYGCREKELDYQMNNLEKLQASRVAYEAARVDYEAARFSYEAEIEATLALAVEALAGVDRFVKDLAPYADTSYPLVPSLARACEIYAELKGEAE